MVSGQEPWTARIRSAVRRPIQSDCLKCPTIDPRFADHPVVIGQLGIRYHAGAPIMHNGVAVGTVCVLDYVPRRLDPIALGSLSEMANIAAAMLTARIEAFAMFSNTRP